MHVSEKKPDEIASKVPEEPFLKNIDTDNTIPGTIYFSFYLHSLTLHFMFHTLHCTFILHYKCIASRNPVLLLTVSLMYSSLRKASLFKLSFNQD